VKEVSQEGVSALPRIGWIGAGRMGVPMAGFILKAGYPVTAFSRNPASRAKLVSQGAQEALSLLECVQEAEIVFASVADDSALREVALGPDGVLAHMRRGTIFADTSTVSAEASALIGEDAQRHDIDYLRAPISGNAASAVTGDVTVLVSGRQPAWERVRPVLAAFSKAQLYLGEGESARYMKLVINTLVVNTAQALAEALALGCKAGLPWDTMLDTIAASTIGSPWLKVKSELLKARDFTPTMTTRLILKDLDLILAAARTHDVPMPLIALTRQLMQASIGAGFADEDYMAIVKLAEQQAGLSSIGIER
jgi:3-hydroxyisobutyrate dehydrogenase-like beta-hydroxyacid dehydrogenase